MKSSIAMRVGAGLLALGAFAPLTHAAEPASDAPPAPPGSLAEAITDGRLLLNLRPRLEIANQGNRPDQAEALTLRSLVGWETRPWKGFGLTLEFIDVSHFSGDFVDKPALVPGAREPLVLDPAFTDVNQLFVDWTGLPDTRLRLGRWALKLDNVRFIGNVEFRQVMQVFDGVQLVNTSLPDTELLYAYVDGVRRIDGNWHDSNTHLLHASHAWSPADKLVAYAYLQDQPFTGSVTGFADNSNAIVGVRADGAHPFGEEFKALYTAEYARQVDYADGDSRIDAHYLRLGAGPQWGSFYLRFDFEQLSSNGGAYAFQMPLATLHLFQGWNDVFVTTPKQGIDDFFWSAGWKLGKAQLLMEYHVIDSDVGSIDYGTELDLSVSYPLAPKLTGKVEYGRFDQGSAAGPPDLDRLWFTLIYNY